MAASVTRATLTALLANVATSYNDFLSLGCPGVPSAAVIATINALLAAYSAAEYNGGAYSTRIVSVLPSCANPSVLLSLLYRAVESPTQLWRVNVCFVPSPNNRGYLVLFSDVDLLTNTDSLIPDNNPGDAIGVYDPTPGAASGVPFLINCGGGDSSCGSKKSSCSKCDGGGCGSCSEAKVDFPSYLNNTLGADFSIRRDCKCCKWVLTTLPSITVGCKINYPKKTVNGINYYSYDSLRKQYEKVNCQTFANKDASDLVALTQCYETWIASVSSNLTFYYVYGNYKRLPKTIRKLVENAGPSCSAAPVVNPTTPIVPQLPQQNPAPCSNLSPCAPVPTPGSVICFVGYAALNCSYVSCSDCFKCPPYKDCCKSHSKCGSKKKKSKCCDSSSSSSDDCCSSSSCSSSSSECCSSSSSSEEECDTSCQTQTTVIKTTTKGKCKVKACPPPCEPEPLCHSNNPPPQSGFGGWTIY